MFKIKFPYWIFRYFNFIYRRENLLTLFNHWRNTSIYFHAPDVHLKRDTILITLCVMISAILENSVLHLEFIAAFDFISGTEFMKNTSDDMSILETYYRRSHYHWANVLDYNGIVAVIAFIQHKCMLYSWNYMDIMIAIFSRAMYFKFKMLYEMSKEMFVKPMKKDRAQCQNDPVHSNYK